MLARWLYTIVLYLMVPLLVVRLYQRARKNPGYRERVAERFGFYGTLPAREGAIWLHTVSVGEFIAAQPLIAKLLEAYPNYPLLITSTTPTGSERVRTALASEISAGRVTNVYLPYDLPTALSRFHGHFKPRILVVMETELWPNLIHFTWRRKIPIIIANARMSEKSAQGYQKVAMLTRPMMREISLIAAQTEADGERFIEMGLPPASLQITGTIKFDLNVSPSDWDTAKALRQRWGAERKIFIAASTHAGEDEQVLEAFRLIHCEMPEALLVLVPRHPERFDPVAELLEQQGWCYGRFSEGSAVPGETQVLLGDAMGQLLPMLGASDVAFVGGSLEPLGGHNMLEPLAMETPAITGPHVFNFAMVAELLTGMGVLVTVSTPMGLAQAVLELLRDDEKRRLLAQEGKRVIFQHRGAVDRLFMHVSRLMS